MKAEPDDNTLFRFKEKMEHPESQETLNMLKKECGTGPFLGRRVYNTCIVLLNSETLEPVYKNTAGITCINMGFVEKCRA